MIPSITSELERNRNRNNQQQRGRRWKIDGTLFPLKLHYFFKDAGCSVILPFIPVIGRQIGISIFNVGLLFSIAAILTLFLKPFIKLIQKQRTVFIISIFCTLICLLCFTIFPTTQQEIIIQSPVQFECGFGSNYIKQCQQDLQKLRQTKLPLICPTNKQLVDILGENYTANTNTNSIVQQYESDILERYSDLIQSVQRYAKDNLHLYYPLLVDNNNNASTAGNNKSVPTTTETAEKPKFPDEICYISCNGIDHIQMQQFCTSFHGPKLPEICYTIEQQGIDETAELYEENVLGSFYYLLFEVKLKMNFITDGKCIFLPIDKISFKTSSLNHAANAASRNNISSIINEDKPEEMDQLPFEKFSCNMNKTIFPNCIANCPKSKLNLNSYLGQFVQSEHSLFSEHVIFWFYAIVLVFGFISLAIFNSITDSYCAKVVGNNLETLYAQKLWGVVGFGLFCLLSAYFVDKVSDDSKIMKNYATCFFLAAGLFVMDLIVSIKLEVRMKEGATNYEPIWKDLQFLLKDPRLILFTIDCLIIGICSAIHKCFLLWHIEELNENSAICSQASDWIKTIQGFMIAVLCFSEVMFFSVAGWLINKFGHFNCLSLVFLMSSIQFAMYSLLSHPWSFVPLEIFQGCILSIFTVAMINHGGSAAAIAQAQAASRQNSQPKVDQFFSTSFSIIGMCIGSIIGGYLFEEMGGKFTFLMVALSCLVSFCIHVALVYCLHKYNMESYGRPVSTGNMNVKNEQKMKRISRTDSEEFHFEFESDID